MIYTYGVSQQGLYHIKQGIVCQDAYCIAKISEELCFAAVADGLGSEKYTDVASRIAVDSVVDHCKLSLTENSTDDEILSAIKDGFAYALKLIGDEAAKEKHDIDQYDTTLSFVAFLRDKIYFGHAGDSGIVVLLTSGEYKAVTKQQRDEYGCVYPLCFTDRWVFGKVENVASVLLATDGMLDTLFPVLLHNEEVQIYVALAQFFMDKESLGFEKLQQNEVEQKISDFVSNIAEAQVSDDKTLVCVLNSTVNTERKEEEYYQIPNWAELKKKKDEEFRRLAYPHLFKGENSDKK